MKILIDIAHPAHIHYFRNFARILENKGHVCLFTLRDNGIIVELANYYRINYRIRSREMKSKIVYMLSSVINIYKIAKQFKPDLFVDMGTVVSSPISKILGKPYIAFDDTEVSIKARFFHMPFTDVIITPTSFYKDLGCKQIRINSIMELMYLKKKYFIPNKEVLGPCINNIANYVIIRFVSWKAHHDEGNKGISYQKKVEIVKYLSSKYDVIISSEGELPKVFEKFQTRIPSHLMHDALAYAKLVITEGATMASESVVLGTPTIYVNSIQNGCTLEQKKIGLLFSLVNDEDLMNKVFKIESIITNIKKYNKIHKDYLESKIDSTAFIVWFIENYPESSQIMNENPDYQNRFK